ncbi:hypothetical protein dqs_1800 [Azoarcus olearius]|uniref:hypothetical protein n=1 Tax=Azoarcus sp. (strain BH72) TaxID=418699 RepID=UPI0008062EB0|nr:hypothetical protein [Azoarcus olearius]ANQ84838.1 hypothetical protein dqs_1800 [Azoarcus olearius]
MPHHTQPTTISLEDLYPVPEFAAENSKILSVDTLRWQLRNRHKNGLATCCVQVGRKLLISKSRYEAWLTEQAGKAVAA